MPRERILDKKLDEINELKSKLVSRRGESKEAVLEKLRESMDDLELILVDFGYISEQRKVFEPAEMYGIDEFAGGFRGEEQQFNLAQLERYDGKEGRPAYVAINGVVYDVTNNPYWKNGKHFGAEAGDNMTNTFYECHANDINVLNKLPVVGKVVD